MSQPLAIDRRLPCKQCGQPTIDPGGNLGMDIDAGYCKTCRLWTTREEIESRPRMGT